MTPHRLPLLQGPQGLGPAHNILNSVVLPPPLCGAADGGGEEVAAVAHIVTVPQPVLGASAVACNPLNLRCTKWAGDAPWPDVIVWEGSASLPVGMRVLSEAIDTRRKGRISGDPALVVAVPEDPDVLIVSRFEAGSLCGEANPTSLSIPHR
eukprot:CAMPEP_0169454800 /NCGR_PEP_ID=MMETSP1042-20121227/15472_1 /TAXON_ID=464988 /ORGANISM="Hemiselmis andersenii, Strain CCMP1180" /LENGTH=151 /DNA_ID=CAMNT_0009566899 /DNA_START=318 /DNA_END=771 /DNA_ORIENTATION=-